MVKAQQTYTSADWQKKATRLARARVKALQNGQLTGLRYVQGPAGTKSTAVAIPVGTIGAVLVNGRGGVHQKLPLKKHVTWREAEEDRAAEDASSRSVTSAQQEKLCFCWH